MDESFKWCVNIATPSPLDANVEEVKVNLIEFYAKNYENIKVNNAFHRVLVSQWHRPGFKFMFWFNSVELAESFKNEFDGEFVDM